MKSDNYMKILAAYASSKFQDFESYLRTVVDLVRDDIGLVLDEYISSFLTYEAPISIYSFKDISEFAAFSFQKENDPSHSINIEIDDITMKTKLVLKSDFIGMRFDEKSFFSTILGFSPHWNNKHYNDTLFKKL